MGLPGSLLEIYRRMKSPRKPMADEVTTISAFLQGRPGESIKLPMLPGAGSGTAGIEFAAASIMERIVLGAMVRQEHPGRIFEIGTFRGVTALSMAVNCTWEAVLWTLDLPPEIGAEEVNQRYYSSNPKSGFRQLADDGTKRDVGSALRGYAGPCQVEQLYGDVATFDFGPYCPVDLFFVDGCHEYEAARRDTLVAWKCLRPGGLLVWHDYTWKSVERAARDSCAGTCITWIERTSLAFGRKP